MKWVVREGKFGDMVRAHINSQVDHYGVYISDDEIIQFGKNPSLGLRVPENEIVVVSTDINEFRNGTFPEFADMSLAEKLKRNSPKKSVQIAKDKLGSGGYNMIHNNCEHFAYECIFGKRYSSQEDLARQLVIKAAIGNNSSKGDET